MRIFYNTKSKPQELKLKYILKLSFAKSGFIQGIEKTNAE